MEIALNFSTRNEATEVERVYFLFTMDFTSVWVDSSQKGNRKVTERKNKNENKGEICKRQIRRRSFLLVLFWIFSIPRWVCIGVIVQVRYGHYTYKWQQKRIQCHRSGALVAVYFAFSAIFFICPVALHGLTLPPTTLSFDIKVSQLMQFQRDRFAILMKSILSNQRSR